MLPSPRTTEFESRERESRVLICVLGGFAIFAVDQLVQLRGAPKTEALVSSLVLASPSGVPRETLLATLWPDALTQFASQSLNSLTHHLQQLLAPSLDGAAVLVHAAGSYRLNYEAGVAVDCLRFDVLANEGERSALRGDAGAAIGAYHRALDFYRGDLSVGTDVRALVERERLRAVYLRVLGWLADYYFREHDYRHSQALAGRLLRSEPTREDAHRLLMRCYARLGERAQALRQFRMCEEILRVEFEARPEPATLALFDQLRLAPADV